MFIRGSSFILFRRGTSKTFTSLKIADEVAIHGQERVTDTARLARLNLAVHGLSGDIKQGNTYYEDLQDSVGRFDFVLALPSAAARSLPRSHPADRPKRRINPPFNEALQSQIQNLRGTRDLLLPQLLSQ